MEKANISDIKLIIADDHEFYRKSLVRSLSRIENIKIVAEASNGIEVLNHIENLAYDLILLDIKMPELNGIETTAQIIKNDHTAKIIIVTFYKDKEYCYNAIQAGAKGILFKNSPIEEIKEAIKEVYKGNFYFTKELNDLFTDNENITKTI